MHGLYHMVVNKSEVGQPRDISIPKNNQYWYCYSYCGRGIDYSNVMVAIMLYMTYITCDLRRYTGTLKTSIFENSVWGWGVFGLGVWVFQDLLRNTTTILNVTTLHSSWSSFLQK